MTISQTNPGLVPDGGAWGPVVRIEDDRRSEAVARLVSDGAQADIDHAVRFLEFARQNDIDLSGMWSRLDRTGAVSSTVLVVPNAGRTAMVFTTRVLTGDDVAPMGGLIDHACREMAADPGPLGDVHLVQVLADPADERDHEAFRAGGFHDLARLSYLERPLSGRRTPAPEAWPPDVEVAAFDDARRDTLLEILDASYEQTLDCPGLRGLRETTDILDGHMTTGRFDPSLWTLLSIEGRPAGALLLNPASQGRSIELVYLGLALFARGRGLGTQLLRHGLRRLRGRREKVVMLAVDDNNLPALRLYEREHFRRVMRRVALIRPTGPCTPIT